MEKTRLEKELEEAQKGKKAANWVVIVLLISLLASIGYIIYLHSRIERLYKEKNILLMEKEALQKDLKSTEEELNILKEKIREGRKDEQRDDG